MAPALSDILRITSPLLMFMFLTFCMGATNLEAQAGGLANEEVEALLEVATQLGKKGWNSNMNLCNQTFLTRKPDDDEVVCSCSFPGGVCHVVGIYLKRQDLNGSLPKAIQKLQYLKELDLWANYLSGPIPPEWADTKLELLSLGVNRLNGTIPSYLGIITTLRSLNIENNMFSGTVPPELGDLVNLENLTLSANNLSGELPLALANLIRLKELRLSSNNFTGRIPEFIKSWRQLDALEIQAGGFTGPIPSNISLLTNLTELDLSFNRLNGPLPTSYDGLTSLEKMYLTWNNLTGPIPDWINTRKSRYTIDLSYNNFTSEAICTETLNLFKSTWGWNYMKPVECLSACSAERYSVHINCGGPAATIGKTTYEADDEKGGAAQYVSTGRDWLKSTTGHFRDDDSSSNTYVAQNMSILRMDNSVLYTNARLTPLSLTYYIPCLVNGNYTVKMHFAEIVMRDNRSYYSLGRRVFDVYIQNIVVLKDFSIVTEAGGVDKVYIHNCTSLVTNGALEIRLHWAGKGTIWSPETGTYGPLISAIDVESDFAPPNNGRRKRFIIAGAVVLPLILIFVLLSSLWWKGYLGGRKPRDRGKWLSQCCLLVGLQKLCSSFDESLIQIKVHWAELVGVHLVRQGVRFKICGRQTSRVQITHYKVAMDQGFRIYGRVPQRLSLGEVLYLQKNGDIMEMVDPRLGSAFNKKEVVRMINVALLCTNQSPTHRPTMSTVVSMLEGKTDVEELDMVPSTSSDQSGYATASFNKFAQASFSGSSSENKSLAKSSEGPRTASSSSSS
ncbi:hypothetical protein OIU78_022655 [Salix suchowensis]|nr:hypothetical protein OIU78_022655 [Salix suchowensis]